MGVFGRQSVLGNWGFIRMSISGGSVPGVVNFLAQILDELDHFVVPRRVFDRQVGRPWVSAIGHLYVP